jgi:hypothetical protein
MKPVVSVIVTCDFASGTAESWNYLRVCLAALARQDFAGPAEFLLVESAGLTEEIPADLRDILPALKIFAAPAVTAEALKNYGVRMAAAELIAFIDGDCVADPGWLSAFVELMREHPDIAGVSGRTMYAPLSFLHRAMALASRSYLDLNRLGPTRHLTVNNAGFRRAVLLAHPFPADMGAHMSLICSAAMLQAGAKLYFDPRLRVEHAYQGWSTEKEIRRSMGYGVIRTRLLDRRLPYARMARLGYVSIPLFVAARTLHSWVNCVKRARPYGLSWYELPATFCLAAAACLLEVDGMIHAVRDVPISKTAYR